MLPLFVVMAAFVCGMQIAIEGPGLTEAQQVVVKGNERIRDGQAIRF